jgi:hypothetical protein
VLLDAIFLETSFGRPDPAAASMRNTAANVVTLPALRQICPWIDKARLSSPASSSI